MTATIRDYYAKRDAEVRAIAHAGLCKKARTLMPNVDADTAEAMRKAMLAGPGNGLRDLVLHVYFTTPEPTPC